MFRTFSSFNRDCALVTPNLRCLTWKNQKFVWGKEEEEEFCAIKRIVLSLGVLSSFDLGRDTYLFVDASRCGLAFILFQKDMEGNFYVITCGSTGLSGPQTRYSVTELECLVAVWALSKCIFWLLGCQKVQMITDHNPLCDMFKKNLTDIHNARLQSIVEKTLDYNIVWSHLKGQKNIVAYLFSRTGLASVAAPEFPRTSNFSVKRVKEGSGIKTVCRDLEVMALQAGDDYFYKRFVDAVKQEKKVTEFSNDAEMKDYMGVWDELGVEETRVGPLITVDGRLMVPKVARMRILENLHSCHPGKPTMITNAHYLYWWPGMKREVITVCEECEVCSLHARSRMKCVPQQQEDISLLDPMDQISLDLHNYGGRVYLSGQDRASGFRWCERLKNQSSWEVIKFVKKIQRLYGKIMCVRSDNGLCFRGPFQA